MAPTNRGSQPKAVAAKKPEAVLSPPKQGKAGTARGTWTQEQVATLRAAIGNHHTATAAFESVSEELGKSVGTIRQKWYALNSKGKRSTERATATRTRRVTTRETMADTVSGLSSDELVALAKTVQAEVRHRQNELQAAGELYA